jgi:hypothetical protein
MSLLGISVTRGTADNRNTLSSSSFPSNTSQGRPFLIVPYIVRQCRQVVKVLRCTEANEFKFITPSSSSSNDEFCDSIQPRRVRRVRETTFEVAEDTSHVLQAVALHRYIYQLILEIRSSQLLSDKIFPRFCHRVGGSQHCIGNLDNVLSASQERTCVAPYSSMTVFLNKPFFFTQLSCSV